MPRGGWALPVLLTVLAASASLSGAGTGPADERPTEPRTLQTASARAAAGDTIGIYRGEGHFHLRDALAGGGADASVALHGAARSDVPLVGDWNGDGRTTPGVFRPGRATFHLRDDLGSGHPHRELAYGEVGDLPVTGDWNGDGRDTVGVFRPRTGQFLLRSSAGGGHAEIVFHFGDGSLDTPLVGDWDGDGRDGIGVHRRSGAFHLRNRLSGGPPDHSFLYGVGGQEQALVGDWNGDGLDSVGVYRPSGARFLLRDRVGPGFADVDVVYGDAGGGDRPVAGAWRARFRGSARALDEATRHRMTGSSWRPGCPVGLDRLRILRVDHRTFGGGVRRGEMVVHADVASDVVRGLRAAFDSGFPIERMRLVDDYGADDDRSMEANNSSAFNCRYVTGRPGVWSRHAYGTAVDLNPVQNPYVTRSGTVLPAAGRAYVDRSQRAPGMIHRGDAMTQSFLGAGWIWGGDWTDPRDYMHFERR